MARKNILVQSGLVVVVATFVMGAYLFVPAVSAQTVSTQRDCDSNAVIRCGVSNTKEINQKYQSDQDVKNIFNYFGISTAEVSAMHDTAKRGYVSKNGNVVLQGKVVATGAVTAGRQNMPGSTKVVKGSTTFYTRTPSVSFAQERLEAFVVMKNGEFQFAVLTSCGNPVKATPKSAPKPQPKPTPPATPPAPPPAQPVVINNTVVQSQTQKQTQIVTPPPAQPAPAPQPSTTPAQKEQPKTLPETGGLETAIGASAAWSVASSIGYLTYVGLKRKFIG